MNAGNCYSEVLNTRLFCLHHDNLVICIPRYKTFAHFDILKYRTHMVYTLIKYDASYWNMVMALTVLPHVTDVCVEGRYPKEGLWTHFYIHKHNYSVFLKVIIILIYGITLMTTDRKQQIKLKTVYFSSFSLEQWQRISYTDNLATVGI